MFKTSIFILVVLALTAQCIDYTRYSNTDLSESELQTLFRAYISGSPYYIDASPERFELFKARVQDIVAHNQDPAKTWTRTINKYTGLTHSELRGTLIMDPQSCSAASSFEVSLAELFDYPSSFDWRDQGKVSPVKNMGTCPSSWAFAATGAIESHVAIQSQSDPGLLSEQQLLDCSSDFSTQGCVSGLPSQAYEYVSYVGGINAENTYPYLMQAEGCVFNASVIDSTVPYGSVNITAGDEGAIIQALIQYGPVSVVFDGSGDFTSYFSGVYSSYTCSQSPSAVNYAGVIVGYGNDQVTGLDYWTVKNSVGSGWGERGYFRIQRGVNMCGIASCASFPNLYGQTDKIVVA